MISSDLAARLKVLLEASVQPLQPARDIPEDLPAFARGQRFSAKILAMLDDGRYQATVGSTKITLSLPQPAGLGDELDLLVVDRTAKTVIANMAPSQPGSLGHEPALTLSRTGALIAGLLGAGGGETETAALTGGQPVLPTPPTGAAEAAPLLRQALMESGMFYESHQARWLTGQVTVDQLLREPQGAHSTASNAAQTVASATGADAIRGTLRSSAEAFAAGVVAEELLPLVQQQLNALATHSFAWSGQIWPGQALQWEIDEPQREHAAAPDESSQVWRTRLRLSLPRLGEVTTDLTLTSSGAAIAIAAGEDVAGEMRQGESALAQALQAAGVPLLGIEVGVHG